MENFCGEEELKSIVDSNSAFVYQFHRKFEHLECSDQALKESYLEALVD